MAKLFIVVEFHMSYDKDMDVKGVFETYEMAEEAIKKEIGNVYETWSLKDKMKQFGYEIIEFELNKFGFIV